MYIEFFTSIIKQRVILKLKNLSLYTLYISLDLVRFEKTSKQFSYKVIVENEGIWFGATFPYIVYGRNERYMV